MKRVNSALWVALVGTTLVGCGSLSTTQPSRPPLSMKLILEKTSYKRGEVIFSQIEIRNTGRNYVDLSYFVPLMVRPELQSVSSPDAPIFLNSPTTDGIPVARKTLRVASGSTKAFSAVKVNIRELNRNDHAFSGYYADLKAGKYYLTLSVKFHDGNGSTWSGVLRTNPIAIIVAE